MEPLEIIAESAERIARVMEHNRERNDVHDIALDILKIMVSKDGFNNEDAANGMDTEMVCNAYILASAFCKTRKSEIDKGVV